MKQLLKKPFIPYLILALSLLALAITWLRGGLETIPFDSDMGRDLGELSKLWIGTKVIWLGPRLSPGFQASPLYYYLFFPALLLGHGNALSLVIFNFLVGLFTLSFLGFFAVRKWGVAGVLSVLMIGLSPWWQGIILHFGNGYSYVFLLLLSLTCMWFDLSLLAASLLLGVAISFHPAAAVAVPVLIYEWWRRKNRAINLLHIFFGLLIPWTPIFLFEVITKGFLFRQWRENPGTGLTAQFNFTNVEYIASQFHLSAVVALVGAVISVIIATKRTRIWWISSLAFLFLVLFVSAVPAHYLLGIICTLSFCFILTYSGTKNGRVVLLCFIAFYIIFDVVAHPLHPASRTITKTKSVVTSFLKKERLDRSKKVAVLAIIDDKAKVPQADDYRFFLRVEGYHALDIQDYSQADILVIFDEIPSFNWKNWSSWEVSQFGKGKFEKVMNSNGVQVVVISRP